MAALGVVLITITTVVFPALILRSLGGFEDHMGVNPFETGVWTYPFLITNLVLLGIGIVYFKNKLPQSIAKSIRFIFNFEISAQVACIVIICLIGIYISFSVSELFDDVYDPDYYERVKSWLENWSITDINTVGLWYHLQLFLLTTSMKVFGSYEVVPFIASIALPVLTYLVTAEISKKRFAGIVSMVIVLQSGIFLIYDTSVSYPNFWILFYLLSLYLIYKKQPLSAISWLLSILSKAMTAAFLPMTLFFIYESNITRQKKIRLAVSYGVIVVLGIVLLSVAGVSLLEVGKFNSHDFWGGFTAFSSEFRFDGLVLVLLLPLTVGLFIASRRRVAHTDSIMFLIMGMLLSAPLMQGFSDLINAPYRFVPLVVFFAIGVGILLSKKITEAT